MRTLLLPALLAVAIGLTGPAGASALIGSAVAGNAATTFSPYLRPVTHQCRVKTVCDDKGENCHTVDVCH